MSTPHDCQAVRAVIFDFNGTLADDEPVLARVFCELLGDAGITISRADYMRELAGLADPEILERAFARAGRELSRARRRQLLRAKVDRYKAIVSDAPPVSAATATLVRAVAERMPVAIASGAAREEVEHVLAATGLADTFAAVVCVEDVARGKPDPEGYRLALALLNRRAAPRPAIQPEETLVFEDSDPGVQSAKAAGMRCTAVASPAYSGFPVPADLVVERLDRAAIRALP